MATISKYNLIHRHHIRKRRYENHKKIISCCTFLFEYLISDVAWSGYSGGNLREISPLSGDDFMQKLFIQQVHDAV